MEKAPNVWPLLAVMTGYELTHMPVINRCRIIALIVVLILIGCGSTVWRRSYSCYDSLNVGIAFKHREEHELRITSAMGELRLSICLEDGTTSEISFESRNFRENLQAFLYYPAIKEGYPDTPGKIRGRFGFEEFDGDFGGAHAFEIGSSASASFEGISIPYWAVIMVLVVFGFIPLRAWGIWRNQIASRRGFDCGRLASEEAEK